MKFLVFFRRKASGNIAKDRLKLVLVSDRANCSPSVIESIRTDILNILAKYVEVNISQVDIQIIQSQSEGEAKVMPALIAKVPFREMNKIHS